MGLAQGAHRARTPRIGHPPVRAARTDNDGLIPAGDPPMKRLPNARQMLKQNCLVAGFFTLPLRGIP
jgi:hypothetical protein